ncbi:MAG: hypothetical protein ACI8SK_000335 [Shewanella sp.]|jgi:hypothetical protein
MRLRALVARPKMFPTFSGISYIHIGQMCLQRYPYLKASSASCFSFINLKLRFIHRPAEVLTHDGSLLGILPLRHWCIPARHLLQAINNNSVMVFGKSTKYQNRPMNPPKRYLKLVIRQVHKDMWGQCKLYLMTKHFLIPLLIFRPFTLADFCPKMSHNQKPQSKR